MYVYISCGVHILEKGHALGAWCSNIDQSAYFYLPLPELGQSQWKYYRSVMNIKFANMYQ